MTVLILNRGSLALRPYHEWLTDYSGELLLLTSREELDAHGERLPPPGAGYAHAEAIDDYDRGGRLEARALELAREYDIRHVVACQELDLQRAAALREVLGLPGQDVLSADCFRDKLLMKCRAAAAGVPVAAHAEVHTAVDVLAFAGKHGFPLVIKPREGLSSVGLLILRNRAELDAWLTDGFDADDGREPSLLVEAFVPGSMYHIDGMVFGGRVAAAWPSQYMYQLAAFCEDDTPRLDATLDPGDPLAGRLLAFTDRVLAALPTPETTTFHAEVFRTPDDELVLCEIASRNGGALIKSVLEALFGVNFPVAWVRASVGLPVPLPADGRRLRPARMAGQVLLLKRSGFIRRMPERPPFPWVERYQPFVRTGEQCPAATSSGDFMVAMVVSGPDRRECEDRMRRAARWFDEELLLEAG